MGWVSFVSLSLSAVCNMRCVPYSEVAASSSFNSLTDQHAGTPMGITAENLAEKYGISREVRCTVIFRHEHANSILTVCHSL